MFISNRTVTNGAILLVAFGILLLLNNRGTAQPRGLRFVRPLPLDNGVL